MINKDKEINKSMFTAFDSIKHPKDMIYLSLYIFLIVLAEWYFNIKAMQYLIDYDFHLTSSPKNIFYSLFIF